MTKKTYPADAAVPAAEQYQSLPTEAALMWHQLQWANACVYNGDGIPRGDLEGLWSWTEDSGRLLGHLVGRSLAVVDYQRNVILLTSSMLPRGPLSDAERARRYRERKRQKQQNVMEQHVTNNVVKHVTRHEERHCGKPVDKSEIHQGFEKDIVHIDGAVTTSNVTESNVTSNVTITRDATLRVENPENKRGRARSRTHARKPGLKINLKNKLNTCSPPNPLSEHQPSSDWESLLEAAPDPLEPSLLESCALLFRKIFTAQTGQMPNMHCKSGPSWADRLEFAAKKRRLEPVALCGELLSHWLKDEEKWAVTHPWAFFQNALNELLIEHDRRRKAQKARERRAKAMRDAEAASVAKGAQARKSGPVSAEQSADVQAAVGELVKTLEQSKGMVN